MKTYGNEKTNLTLSEKAFKAYSNSDPCDIIEHDDGTYSMRGILDRDNMTEADVNQVLEELWDETHSYRVLPEFWDGWFGGLSVEEIGDAIVTEDEIRRLAREWGMSVEELMAHVEKA